MSTREQQDRDAQAVIEDQIRFRYMAQFHTFTVLALLETAYAHVPELERKQELGKFMARFVQQMREVINANTKAIKKPKDAEEYRLIHTKIVGDLSHDLLIMLKVSPDESASEVLQK